MGKVLKADASAADAWVEYDLPSDEPEVWLTFRLALPAAAIALWLTNDSGDFADLADSGGFGSVLAGPFDHFGDWKDDGGATTGGTPGPVADTWMLCELHYTQSGGTEFFVNGTSIYTAVSHATQVNAFRMGQYFALVDADAIAYIDDVLLGTTRGASDLFSDDFETGNLFFWTATSGAVSVVDDPFPPPPPANDDLANVQELVGLAGSTAGSTINATDDAPYDPMVDFGYGHDTVWYKLAVPDEWDDTSRLTFTISGADPFSSSTAWLIFNASTYPPASSGDWSSLGGVGPAPVVNGEFYYEGLAPPDGFFYLGLCANSIGQETDFTLSWLFDVPSPTPFTGLVLADLPVRMFVTSIAGETISILDHRATQRQFLFRLNAPAYTTGQVASDDNEINLPWPDPDSPASVTNNRRLLFALQRWKGATPPYQPIFGGIITTPEDQGSDAPTTRYTASDPWQLLMSRPIRRSDLALPTIDGLKFPDQSRASDIALELLQLTDLVDGETHIDFSDTGLIEDSTPLDGGITFDRSLSVGEAWTQLCDTGTIDIHLDPIYDPHGRPTKCVELRIVAQTEGTAAGPVLYDLVMSWDGPGHSLMGINRLVDGTRLANKVLYFAGQGGVPAPLQQDAASIAAYGEYWSQQSFPGSHDRTTIALLALTELLIRRDGARSIQFDPAPERVEQPIKDYNLGDYLPVWASRNLREPLGVDYDAFDPDNPGASGYQRIYAIPMDVDDNGVTIVRGLITSKEN